MTLSIPSNSPSRQRKRQRSEDNEDESEYDASGFMDDDNERFKFGTAVLPVANLPNSYEGIPQNGMEYLFTVRREERSLPLVTRVRNPYPTEQAQVARFVPSNHIEGSIENDTAIPSVEWRTCFEERFRNLRKNMRQSTIHVALPENTALPKLPAMRDRDRWWAFFRGDVDWERIPCSQFHNPQGKKKNFNQLIHEITISKPVVYQETLSWDDTEEGDVQLTYQTEEQIEEDGQLPDLLEENDSQSVSASTNQQSENEVLQLREPTPRILALLDQKFVFHLLKYFTQWIQGHFDHTFLPAPPEPPDPNMKRVYDFTSRHGRWIFALLTQLDSQLTSDEISILRSLVREIFKLIKEERLDREDRFSTRSQISHMGEVGCWMIVAAVTGVWGQRDLWDDAGCALR